MTSWPYNQLKDLLEIDLPVFLAPMAGCGGVDLAVAVASAGGLASYPCAYVKPEKIRDDVVAIRSQTNRPLNMNFFCHTEPDFRAAAQDQWRETLGAYYEEFGAQLPPRIDQAPPTAFDDILCGLVEELKPSVVSFHFGLPEKTLLERVKATEATILCSATTVAEARYLEEAGVHAIIAQGVEAGGHRGMFLSTDIGSQVGTLALVPQIVDAVSVPVIAAGGISDGRGVAAAFALGASAVQLGTAYLRCPEALTSDVHRKALAETADNASVLTNVFSGKPARSIANRLVREQGPINAQLPEFPLVTRELGPLRAASQAMGDADFTSLWSGQAASLGSDVSAVEVTQKIACDALEIMRGLGAS